MAKISTLGAEANVGKIRSEKPRGLDPLTARFPSDFSRGHIGALRRGYFGPYGRSSKKPTVGRQDDPR